MKKLMGIIAIAILSLSTSFAQTTPTTKKATPVATAKSTPKKETKTAPVAGPTKKDGTADMRYSANKNAKVAGPKKKDGTADMRYKANQPAVSKTAPKKN